MALQTKGAGVRKAIDRRGEAPVDDELVLQAYFDAASTLSLL